MFKQKAKKASNPFAAKKKSPGSGGDEGVDIDDVLEEIDEAEAQAQAEQDEKERQEAIAAYRRDNPREKRSSCCFGPCCGL